MNRKFNIYAFLLAAFWVGGVVLFTGCKKNPVAPTLTTMDASDISVSTAKTGGNITSDGGAEVTARGVCWGLDSQPLISGLHTSDSKGNGTFSSSLTGLTPETTYYVRAYAVNKAGTAYGNEVSFETMPLTVPVIATLDVTGVTTNSAVSGGNITLDGGSPVTIRGVCWATTANPTTSDNKTSDGTGTGSFASDLTGLLPGTTYHVRAYATSSVGTAYGNDLSFTTLAVRPSLTTATISAITRNSAVSGGNITSSGGAPVTARGVCWSTTSGPVATGMHTSDGQGTGIFTSDITDLNPNTLYFVRAYATNIVVTSYGNEVTFTTDPVTVPTLTTNSVTDVTLTTALSGGNITSDNGAAITEKGVCWNTTGTPTTASSSTSDGSGTGSFTSNITGLTAGTVYYLRAYASNSAGTGYGNQIIFSTSIADIDLNVYKTVLIGTQLWMQSDLKTTRLNSGTPITNVPDNDDWKDFASAGYCWYNNNPSYGTTYGMIYNWYAVETGELCPSGWHVPADAEYKTLELHLGMTQAETDNSGWRGTNQGTQLKSTSTWNPSTGTNSSGFTAVGGGYRYGVDGSFNDLGLVGYWWSSTLKWDDTTKAMYRRLDSNEAKVFREGVIKTGGKFVRCLKY